MKLEHPKKVFYTKVKTLTKKSFDKFKLVQNLDF